MNLKEKNQYLYKHRLAFYTLLSGFTILFTTTASILFVQANSASPSPFYHIFTSEQQALWQSEEVVKLHTFQTWELNIPAGFEVVSLPESKRFKLTNNILKFSPQKKDSGTYSFVLRSKRAYSSVRKIYKLNVSTPEFDSKALAKKLDKLLVGQKKHFGIYIYDLQRSQTFGINQQKIYPPASIAKIPVAILVLRDIDAGKRKLTDTFAIQDKHKHGTTEQLAKYPAGKKVTVKEYLERMILESSNTALYHLRVMLGGSFEAVNPRTIKELKANPFFENPLKATAQQVGKVLNDLYQRKTLSEKSASYLLGLMQSTPPDLRLAIPSGVPANTKVANKVGFLFGGLEGSTYADSAIVFGPKTDYVLVVLNDKAPEYPYGSQIISQISTIVYNQLQK